MDQNSVESDDNSVDQMDDNLLEPLSEVSFHEREKSFHPTKSASNPNSNANDKDPDSSLPDARARVLHLQRVQRGGGSSGSETARSSSSKKRSSKSHSDEKDTEKDKEKEEGTVSLSLDSLIRRGVMNEGIKAANFKSNFKFGKPDDDISLRVNPSANFFYDHDEPYSDTNSSDSYESSGEREGPDETKYGMTSNGSITNGNGLDDHAPTKMKRKRGRPPLTEEERNERAARKEAIRLQNQSVMNSSTMPGEVDDFAMAMGHSIFHVNSPRKRGRPPKNKYPHFLNSTVRSEPNPDTNASRFNDSTNSGVCPIKKEKRGRKPKSYYLELAAAQANDSSENTDTHNGTAISNVSNVSNQTVSTLNETTLTRPGPKKRGRKPKYMENYFIKLEQRSVPLTGPKILKKRGRKPKSFYLQQMAERANETAPAILQEASPGSGNAESIQQTPQSDATARASTSFDFGSYTKKRGRRPKAYYEHLATMVKQEGGQSLLNRTVGQKFSAANSSIISDEPPLKKKRGRKPKSYYWNLQTTDPLQQAENQNRPSNAKGDSLSSQDRLATEYEEQANSGSTNLIRRFSKSNVHKTYVHRSYVRRVVPKAKIFQRPVRNVT